MFILVDFRPRLDSGEHFPNGFREGPNLSDVRQNYIFLLSLS